MEFRHCGSHRHRPSHHRPATIGPLRLLLPHYRVPGEFRELVCFLVCLEPLTLSIAAMAIHGTTAHRRLLPYEGDHRALCQYLQLRLD